MGRRLFLAFFGGLFPDVWKVGDRKGRPYSFGTMDSVVAAAYGQAVAAAGGDVRTRDGSYMVTRREWVARMEHAGRTPTAAQRRAPDWVRVLHGEMTRVLMPRSENTFIRPAQDLRSAVTRVLEFTRPGDKIAELFLLDHGLVDPDGGVRSMAFGTGSPLAGYSMEPGSFNDRQLTRLRPWVDAQTVVTLGGCAVGSTREGQALLMAIARTLGVHAQAFVDNQFPIIPGIEGATIHCDPSGCLAAEPTPFAQVMNGSTWVAWGNEEPEWD